MLEGNLDPSRDGCDITAARRSYDRLASGSKKNENCDQKPEESIVHGNQKRYIRI